MKKEKILVTGAFGQIGSELLVALQNKHGIENVVASDIRISEDYEGIFEKLDVLDKNILYNIISKHKITTVYNLASFLSATAEKNTDFAWKLNTEGHLNILNLAKEKKIHKIFWPSSIAVFGNKTQKINTPQTCIMNPNTVYGISKLSGELWNIYYYEKFGVEVRSVRYPGIISYKSLPGGGTTDYAVDIFYKAKAKQFYTCFLNETTTLPMMYIDDAIRATIELMDADSEKIKQRGSYNLAAISFCPKDLAIEIKKYISNFTIEYKPDFRQSIAKSWPEIIDDTDAQKDWNWKYEFGIEKLVKIMLDNIKPI